MSNSTSISIIHIYQGQCTHTCTISLISSFHAHIIQSTYIHTSERARTRTRHTHNLETTTNWLAIHRQPLAEQNNTHAYDWNMPNKRLPCNTLASEIQCGLGRIHPSARPDSAGSDAKGRDTPDTMIQWECQQNNVVNKQHSGGCERSIPRNPRACQTFTNIFSNMHKQTTTERQTHHHA